MVLDQQGFGDILGTDPTSYVGTPGTDHCQGGFPLRAAKGEGKAEETFNRYNKTIVNGYKMGNWCFPSPSQYGGLLGGAGFCLEKLHACLELCFWL